MTRREKVQLAILEEVHARDPEDLGPDGPSLDALAGYSGETVRAIAAEMKAERLLEAALDETEDPPEWVRPAGLTDRGDEYRRLLARRDREESVA